MAVTVYSTPSCVKCDTTKRELAKRSIPFDSINLAADPEALAFIRGRGHQTAPAVLVTNGAGEIVDEWSDFRYDKIAQLV